MQGSETGLEGMTSAICMALARLGVSNDPPLLVGFPLRQVLGVPPSSDNIRATEVLGGPQVFFSPDQLAGPHMQDASTYGPVRMPTVEPTIASLIASLDEAVSPNAHCARAQCHR